jgi:hypothetical protein
MAFNNQDAEIECKIIESYGIFSQGIRFWNKEVNLVSWNGMPAKLDIRNWQRDHAKCGKGIAVTREEAEELVKLLSAVLRAKPKAERAEGGASERPRASKRTGPSKKPETPKEQSRNRPEVPTVLEPFYRELKLRFGAVPEECKTARNTLLKKYHPDVNAGNAAYATGKTIKIKEAYEKIAAWWNEKHPG